MKQYFLVDVWYCSYGQKLRAFANELDNFLFLIFSEDDILAFRKAAFALGLAFDERYGGEPMQITLDTHPKGYVLIAKNGTPSNIVIASFREIRGHYKANDNNKNE